MKILVSACLLGENCKYNGGNNDDPAVHAFLRGKEFIPVCPEMAAGLGCPRTPIEIRDGVVIDRNGNSVDGAIREAVGRILAQIGDEEIQCAVLKSRSPTCGVKEVYDGTFSGRKVLGAGVFAQALMDGGYRVIDCEELH